MRRGQVSVEYLAIFGLVLLAIVAAVSFISGTGFLNPCQETTPTFTGSAIEVDDAQFTATNNLTVAVSAVGDDLTDVTAGVDTNGDGTFDYTSNASNAIDLSAGGSGQNLLVETGTEFSTGECASVQLGFEYDTEEIENVTKMGSTALTRTIP